MAWSNYKSLKQDKIQLVFAPSSLILTNYYLPLSEALALQGGILSHGNCPKCNHEIEPFGLSFSRFPFYFNCSSCKVRLKLVSSKVFWSTVGLYSLAMILFIVYVPLARQYGLSVIISILGWFITYYKMSGYWLKANNLKVNE